MQVQAAQATTRFFQTMMGLKEANAVLSKRLVQLFEINFEELKLPQKAQILEQDEIKSNRSDLLTPKRPNTGNVALEASSIREIPQSLQVTSASKMFKRKTIDIQMLKSLSTGDHLNRQISAPSNNATQFRRQITFDNTSECGSQEMQQVYTLTPSNFQLLLKFFEFVSQCPYALDENLIELVERVLPIAFNSRIKGFASQDRVKFSILKSVTSSLINILENKSLQKDIKIAILEHLNDPENAFLQKVESEVRVNQIDDLGKFVNQLEIKLQTDNHELEALSPLTQFLSFSRKRDLTRLICDELIKTEREQRQKAAQQDEHPDPQKRAERQTLLLTILSHILVQNGNLPLQDNDEDGSLGPQQEENQLLDDSMLDMLRNICLNKFQQLFEGKIRSQRDFNTLMDPHCRLLFQLIYLKEDMDKQVIFAKSFASSSDRAQDELSGQDPEEANKQELTVLEVFILVVKTCFNEAQPKMKISQLRQFLQALLEACEVQILKREYYDSEPLSEVLQTLAVFGASVNMHGVNQSLFESIFDETDSSEGSGTLHSDEARTRGNKSESSLQFFQANMEGAPLFEETIAELFKLEMRYLTQSKVGYSLEASASKRFLSKLVSVAQSTQASDTNLPKLISFTASLARIIVSQKTLQASEMAISSLQNQVASLLQRIMQCFLQQHDSSQPHLLSYLKNVIRLALNDFHSFCPESVDLSRLFLEELRKLYQRRGVQHTFVQVSAIVLDAFKHYAVEQQNYELVELKVQFFELFVEMLEQILVQERIQLPQERLLQTVELLTEVLTAGGHHHEQKVQQTITAQLKNLMWRLWLLLAYTDATYLMSQDGEVILSKLAKLTLTSNFNEHTRLLNHQSAVYQERLNLFCTSVFARFEAEVQQAYASDLNSDSVNVGQSTTLLLEESKSSPSKKDRRRPSIAMQPESEEGDEVDAELELRSTSADLSFNEKVYLAVFILIQRLKVTESAQKPVVMPFTKQHQACESILAAFERETALITNDFSDDSSIGQKTLFCQHLEASAKSLIAIHLRKLQEKSETGSWSQNQNFAIEKDFNALIRGCCQEQDLVRNLSQGLINNFEQHFPSLILHGPVLENLLDVITTMHSALIDFYDGNTRIIKLRLQDQVINLPLKHADRLNSLTFLAKLLQKMFIKGAIICQDSLWTNFEKLLLKDKTVVAQSLATGSAEGFGTSYFKQIKSQLDLSKVDTGKIFKNFYTLRSLAVKSPLKFDKLVEDQIIAQAFTGDKSALNDFSKLLMLQPQVGSLETAIKEPKPFAFKLKSHSCTQVSLPSEVRQISQAEAEKQAKDLVLAVQNSLVTLSQVKVIKQLREQNARKEIKDFCCIQVKLAMDKSSDEDDAAEKENKIQQMIYMDTDAEIHAAALELKHGVIAMVEFAIIVEGAVPTVSHYLLQFVTLLLTAELAGDICSEVFAILKDHTALLEELLQNLPIALAVGKVKHKDESKTYPAFEVTDRVKQTLKSQKPDARAMLHDSLELANCLQKWRNQQHKSIRNINLTASPSTLLKIEPILTTIFDIETLNFLLQSNPKRNKDALLSSLLLIFESLSECISSKYSLKNPSFARTALKAIKAGLAMFETTGESTIKSRLGAFIAQFVRFHHSFNYRRDTKLEFAEELQLIEDVKFLLLQNAELFTGQVLKECPQNREKIDLHRSTSAASREDFKQCEQNYEENGLTSTNVAQIFITALQGMKLTLVASNYSEVMQLGAIDPNQLYLTHQQASGFAAMFPKLALTLATKHQAQFKFLLGPITTVIEKEPRRFFKQKGACHLYLQQLLKKAPNSTQLVNKFSYWRLGLILQLVQFLSFNHLKSSISNQFALKALTYAEPKVVIFYLPQLFQAMRHDETNQIAHFLLQQSKESASIAHNVLWFCKVESVLEQGTGRKVNLPGPETLPEIAQKLYLKLLSTSQMNKSQREFFETETDFFEKITSISGLLQPSQSKDEKKAIIREKLIEYNKEIPECVYLPTNQTCRVVGIVTSSGQPMQSAARVPILISFEVESYQGPDRDPILADQDLVKRMARQAGQEQQHHVDEDNSQRLIQSRRPSRDVQDSIADVIGDDETLCHQIETYQMDIKRNIQRQIGGVVEERKMNRFGSSTDIEQGHFNDNRRERELLLQSLSAQFREPVRPKKDSAFTLVANMLTNMQDALPAKSNKQGGKQALISGSKTSALTIKRNQNQSVVPVPTRIISCIFKVNDDLRQDILALQVIKLFQKIFKKCDLDLYVVPYKCISNRTGDDRLLGGLIEVIPNSYSRDQLGKAFEINLHKYFLKRYGSETSAQFQQARLNFTRSLAAYCVVSYILQIKDRHNGNIMIDEAGHLIHIDFGFIFDWSPGRDMRFESANFKLTSEFIDILGGDTQAEAYKLFTKKVVQGFLAVREHADEIQNMVELMWYSGFPCFKPVSLENLELRFRKDLNDFDAARYMNFCITDAHDKWTTRIYDFIQSKQNKIFF